jgi:hypothetical protein
MSRYIVKAIYLEKLEWDLQFGMEGVYPTAFPLSVNFPYLIGPTLILVFSLSGFQLFVAMLLTSTVNQIN